MSNSTPSMMMRISSQNNTETVSASASASATSISSQSSGSATMVDMSSVLNLRRPAKTTSITYATLPPKNLQQQQQQQQQHPFVRNSGNSVTTASSNSLTADDNGTSNVFEQQQEQEEGVLRDVLQELDKERTRRAELEAQIRQMQAEKTTLEQELQIVVQSNANAVLCTQTLQAVAEESEISRRAFLAMEAQVQGYQDIVDALTLGKPAIAHAAAEEKAALELSSSSSSFKNSSPRQKNRLRQEAAAKAASSISSTSTSPTSSLGNTALGIIATPTLPLHVVRLLEVMPWDTRTQVHVFGKEEIYEWQVWNEREQSWSSSSTNIKLFPRVFQTMPIATGTKAVAAASANNNTGTSSIVTNNNSIGRGAAEQRNLLVFLAGGGEKNKPVHLPTKHGVLTNVGMNYILNIEAGYPLPQDGGVWQWVGGWRIDKRVTAAAASTTTLDDGGGDDHNSDIALLQTQKSGADGIMPVLRNHSDSSNQSSSSGNGSISNGRKVRNKVDCDENGWSYATDATHFQTHPTELVWDNPGGNCGHEATDSISTTANNATTDSIVTVERKIRRRKWSRQRVLVSYPHASEGTKQYLKLLAENARLTMTANKVSDQLVETKLSLTETEEKLESARTEMAQQMALLQQELREKTQLLQQAGVAAVVPNTKAALSSSSSSSQTQNALHELFNKSEHGKQQLGSKFSQWIHGSSGRKNSEDASTASNDSAEDNPVGLSGSAHSTASANAATASAEVAAVAAAQAAMVSSSVSSTGSGGSSSSSGVFDWRKVGPSTLLDKFKPAAASSNINDNTTTTTTTMSSSARRSFFGKGSLSSNLDDNENDLTGAVSVSNQNDDNKKDVTETIDDES